MGRAIRKMGKEQQRWMDNPEHRYEVNVETTMVLSGYAKTMAEAKALLHYNTHQVKHIKDIAMSREAMTVGLIGTGAFVAICLYDNMWNALLKSIGITAGFYIWTKASNIIDWYRAKKAVRRGVKK